MSSILDALRKLEQEKATREQSLASTPARELALEPELDLTGERGRRSSPAKTAFLVLGGALVTVGIGAGVIAAAVMVSRRDAPVQRAAASPPNQAAALTTTVKPVQVAAESKPVKVASAAATKQVTAKKPEAQSKPAPQPAPAAAKPEPALPALAKPSNASTNDPPAPASTAAGIDIEKLPILSESVRVRLGLPPLKINIVGIPNSRNPRASALINMQKVYVGENIPGTSARLIDVNLRGVGVDVNGQRYFLSRR
jgi:hypothetical protein